MTELEHRLRERIDQLTEQRDAALAELWKVRDTLTPPRCAVCGDVGCPHCPKVDHRAVPMNR